MKKVMSVLITVILCATGSMANLMTVPAHANDAYFGGTAAQSGTQTLGRVGDGSANSPFVFVIPFQLPALTGGNTISDVKLNIYCESKTSFSSNLIYMDVVGLRVNALPTLSSTDYDMTLGTVVGNNVQLINKNVTTPFSASYTLSTAFFQAIYDGDASAAGKYVFLVLGTDGIDPNAANSYLSFSSADSATVSNRPSLSITSTIPEPATIGLLGFGVLASICIRRLRG